MWNGACRKHCFTRTQSQTVLKLKSGTHSASLATFFCPLPASPNSSSTQILMPFPPCSLHHASSQNFLEKAPTSTGPIVLGTGGLSSAAHINSAGPGHWFVWVGNMGTLLVFVLLPATSTLGGWQPCARPQAQRCAQSPHLLAGTLLL